VIQRRVFQSLSGAIGSKPGIISPPADANSGWGALFGLIADTSREYA
jgi:hypothetical protein